MPHWIVELEHYYQCPICRYTYDNRIDRVSDKGECPNCLNSIEEEKPTKNTERKSFMRHLIVLSEDEIKSLLEGKKIEVISYGNPPIVIMSEDTFNAEENE